MHSFRTRQHQILAKWGPDSTFAAEENTKTQCPKSSQFRLVKMMDLGRVIRPRVEYRVEHQVEYWLKEGKKNRESKILSAL